MRKFLIVLVLILSVTPASAQWRRAGLYGADVRALISDPTNPDTLFLGTSAGEVYVSRDAAKTWVNPRTSVPFPGFIVDNLVLDRTGRLWAASWGLWEGGVIAVSDDQGQTWSRRDAGLEDFSVRAIAVDPNDEDYVLVGGLTGVYRSTNSGKSWTKISDQINVESLAIDPRTNQRIYVGTWRQGWRSEDGGKTWTHIANGMVLDTDMFSIRINPKNPDNLWVSTCGWVYGSDNRGDKWTRYRDGFNNRRIHDIDMDPCDDDVVYAGSVAGLYRSEDRGKSWYTVSSEDMVINSIVLHPQRPERIILGVEGDGVYVSNDRGRTFERSSTGLHNLRITSIVSDPVAKDRVYAAVAFGGAASGLYTSGDAGKTWDRVAAELPPVLSLTIAPETSAENRFLVGTEKGFFYSADGKKWTQAFPSNFPIRVNKIVRFNQIRSFAATSEGVFTTRDGGKNWYRLAGSDDRTLDIVVGSIAGNKALFALTANGMTAFDGERWIKIDNAPSKGKTLAVRTIEGVQHVFVAGAKGVKAGRINEGAVWIPAEAPDAEFASVYGDTRRSDELLFLTSRQQREILVGVPQHRHWMEIVLPMTNHTEITSVASDPFSERYYIGTVGEGVFVYEGKTQRYVAKTNRRGASVAEAGAQ